MLERSALARLSGSMSCERPVATNLTAPPRQHGPLSLGPNSLKSPGRGSAQKHGRSVHVTGRLVCDQPRSEWPRAACSGEADALTGHADVASDPCVASVPSPPKAMCSKTGGST